VQNKKLAINPKLQTKIVAIHPVHVTKGNSGGK